MLSNISTDYRISCKCHYIHTKQ